MSRLQSETALDIIEDILLNNSPEAMRESLRLMMDCYFLFNEVDREHVKEVYATYSNLDRALKKLETTRISPFEDMN